MPASRLFTRDFTLMTVGQIISLFGNAILRFALSLHVLALTGSAAVFGAAEGLNPAKNANRPKISSGGSLSCKLSSPTAPSRLERRRPSAVSSRGKWQKTGGVRPSRE